MRSVGSTPALGGIAGLAAAGFVVGLASFFEAGPDFATDFFSDARESFSVLALSKSTEIIGLN